MFIMFIIAGFAERGRTRARCRRPGASALFIIIVIIFIMMLALISGDDTLRINFAIFSGALRVPECIKIHGFNSFSY